MRQSIIVILLLANALIAYSQSDFDTWNTRYPLTNMKELIGLEKNYADSIDLNKIKPGYYCRMDMYSFSGKYSGEKRIINDSTVNSMKQVYWLNGNRDYVYSIESIKYEYKFVIDGEIYWFSMQNVLDKPFKKEIKKNDKVRLYCLFLNEHKENGTLQNSFLISEFYKE